MQRLPVKGIIADLNGDEMARVVWDMVKQTLITPYLAVQFDCYDLSLANREATGDQVTRDAARSIKQNMVGAKCTTITPSRELAEALGLRHALISPNATIRAAIDGVLFREPIPAPNIPRLVPGWSKPIVIGRHACGDQYQAVEIAVRGPGTITLTFTPESGSEPVQLNVATMPDNGGVALAMYNYVDSIRAFARASMNYGLRHRLPVYFGTKHTVLATYDAEFKAIFDAVYDVEFKADFDRFGLRYEHMLIDDMVAFALRADGGFVWACKNYDGDVFSDLLAQGYGSHQMVASVLMSADGDTLLAEVDTGLRTGTHDYAEFCAGRATSTNPIAFVYAWSRALAHRGELDRTDEVIAFARLLEHSCLAAVESGQMTRDLAVLQGPDVPWLTTEQMIAAIDRQVRSAMG